MSKKNTTQMSYTIRLTSFSCSGINKSREKKNKKPQLLLRTPRLPHSVISLYHKVFCADWKGKKAESQVIF